MWLGHFDDEHRENIDFLVITAKREDESFRQAPSIGKIPSIERQRLGKAWHELLAFHFA